MPWRDATIGFITVFRSMEALIPLSIEDAVRQVIGAWKEIVHLHLEPLAILGAVRDVGGRRYAETGAA